MKCFGEKIRNYHCKVVLLDDQELIQEIQSTSLGQELLETIFKHLNLIETSYFGLRYIDNTEQAHWLDPGKKIIRQLEGMESFTLYFGVKFYAADPCKLVEEITRYQFFLQIKQDILQGRLPVPSDLTAELFAYAVQSELGDYDSRRHGTGYISEFQFTSNQSHELEGSIADLHKAMIGQVPAVAELNYLEKVKWLEMYGVDLHPVMGEDNTDYFLGLTPSGVIVLRNKTKVGNYFWPRISKLNEKGKYFMLRVKNKNNEEQTYGFETPSKAACRHLWRCATEHHAFFRLVQVVPTTKSHSLNSRFRDSSHSDVSVCRRIQPQFIRTPSRRYQRRIVEGAQDDSLELKDENLKEQNQIGFKKTIAVPQPVDAGSAYRGASSITAPTLRSDSPRSTRSAPWPSGKSRQAQSSIPSPKSVRSAGVGSSNVQNRERSSDRHHHRSRKRSMSAESNSSCESRSHRRHRHRGRRGGSDVDSDLSRASGSHGKRRHHKSGSRSRRGDSGSDSENCSHKHKHRNRKSDKKYELVDSEAQWKEVQKKQAQLAVQQAAVVQSIGNVNTSVNLPLVNSSQITTTPIRKSGYLNSGVETESEVSYSQNRRKQRRSHRSNSPDKRLSSELKRHLDFKLIDTDDMTEEQRRQIPYHKVETNQDKMMKSGRIRHNSSVKSNRSSSVQAQQPNDNRDDVIRNINSDVKLLAELGICDTDSPPPPYSPSPANHITNLSLKPSLPQKPAISTLGPGLATQMTQSKTVDYNHIVTNAVSRNSSLSEIARSAPVMKSRQMSQPQQRLINDQRVQQQYATINSSNSTQLQYGKSNPMGLSHQELGHLTSFHPSPSESPDSQKVDSHHENSDSGLGTDHHEYYKIENFSSLGYEVSPRSQSEQKKSFSSPLTINKVTDWTGAGGQPSNTTSNNSSTTYVNQHSNYWSNVTQAELNSQQPWFPERCNARRGQTLGMRQRMTPSANLTSSPASACTNINYEMGLDSRTVELGGRGSMLRSSSLEIILSPLLTSTRTRL